MPKHNAITEAKSSRSKELKSLIEHLIYIQTDVKEESALAGDKLSQAIAVLSFILYASNLPESE